MRALYITRKYPPSVGGMQKMNHALSMALSGRMEVDRLVWGRSQAFLPFFIFKTAVLGILYGFFRRRRYDVIFLGDGLLAPLGLFYKNLMRKPVICIVHGLDVTFKNIFYQKWVIPALRVMDRVICVSRSSKDECLKRGVTEDRLRIIPNGVDVPSAAPDKEAFARELEQKGVSIPEDAKLLLTVGRLVKRKGVADFTENVLPGLVKEDGKIVYLVAGSGREEGNIRDVIRKSALQDNVFLLGKVREELLTGLYAHSDVFVMPNIPVEGDVEGFGIVALEASAHGLPVVATALEGIKDAVKDGQNGYLIPPGDKGIFRERIRSLLGDDAFRGAIGKNAKAFASTHSWDEVAARYEEEARSVTGGKGKSILMVSRAVEPPWNEASKNLVNNITSSIDRYMFHILTVRGAETGKENVIPERVYTSGELELSMLQKMRLLNFLLRTRSKFDLYHFCFTPEVLTSFILKRMGIKGKIIQSIPYLSSKVSEEGYKSLIFADAVTVTSKYTRDILDRNGVRNTHVIYPGVDINRFSPENDKELAKKMFALSGKFVVLWAGDLATVTVVETLFEMIRRTCRTEESIDFVIASRTKGKEDPAMRLELQKRLMENDLKDRVVFLETVDDMVSLMAASDCLIYPLFEGFRRKIDIPYVIIEAMATGLPVVISDKEPVSEVLKDGAGVAVKGEDAGEFAFKINELYKNRDLREELARRNREAAVRYFDLKGSVEKFEEIYGSLLK